MFWHWITQRLSGLSIIGFVGLLSLLALMPISEAANPDSSSLEWGQFVELSVLSQLLVLYYLCLGLHIGWFLIRTSLAFLHSAWQVKETVSRRKESCSSGSSADKEDASEVIHAIVIPNYREDIDTLSVTLGTLARHPRAKSQYEVYLAMEEKEVEAHQKASTLLRQFKAFFREMHAIFHPDGLPGEAAGKGANENFAVQRIRTIHRADPNVIVTIMDADSLVWEDYFTEIRHLHSQHPDSAAQTLYTCPIIFDRNSHQTPFLVRCMDIVWCWVCISSMYPGSHLSIPVSIYSVALPLVEAVDGWDTDHTAIGEDFHMMLKCFFKLRANLVTRTVHVPASQCNVSGPGNGWRRALATCHARYKQGLRHMWGGALDLGYAVRHGVSVSRRASLLQWKTVILFQRLWEAYLLPNHFVVLQLFAIGRGLATSAASIPSASSQLDLALQWIHRISGLLCAFSMAGTCLCFLVYHRWYSSCLALRRKDILPSHTGLAESDFAPRIWWHLSHLSEIWGIYFAGILYSCCPLFHAAICHFWTDRLVYEVSEKPNLSQSQTSQIPMAAV